MAPFLKCCCWLQSSFGGCFAQLSTTPAGVVCLCLAVTATPACLRHREPPVTTTLSNQAILLLLQQCRVETHTQTLSLTQICVCYTHSLSLTHTRARAQLHATLCGGEWHLHTCSLSLLHVHTHAHNLYLTHTHTLFLSHNTQTCVHACRTCPMSLSCPTVAVASAWVSPRVNSAEPCTQRAIMPAWQLMGRSSPGWRPSTRLPPCVGCELGMGSDWVRTATRAMVAGWLLGEDAFQATVLCDWHQGVID